MDRPDWQQGIKGRVPCEAGCGRIYYTQEGSWEDGVIRVASNIEASTHLEAGSGGVAHPELVRYYMAT